MGSVKLRSEQIYEAMVDDEAFANLPGVVAAAVGARSCTIHWRDADDQAEILSHSRYFSDAQMLSYAEQFTPHDHWTNRASSPAFLNQVWDAEQLVPSSEYDRSVFYNEWIRAMGDDTFHCVGSVMQTGRGLGIIGLHRGRGQGSFDYEAIRAVKRNITHLRRMLTVRARLVRDSTRLRDLAALLDCNPDPMFAVKAGRRLVHVNAAGQALLAAGGLVREGGGQLAARYADQDAALGDALARAAHPAAPHASSVTLVAPDGRTMELTIAPVSDGGTGLVLVAGRDPDAQLRRALAPLDPREAIAPRELLVARGVALGLRNHDIAERLGLTEGTVKVYLHNLYAKVGVSSRTELALRIARQPQG